MNRKTFKELWKKRNEARDKSIAIGRFGRQAIRGMIRKVVAYRPGKIGLSAVSVGIAQDYGGHILPRRTRKEYARTMGKPAHRYFNGPEIRVMPKIKHHQKRSAKPSEQSIGFWQRLVHKVKRFIGGGKLDAHQTH